MYYIIIPNRVSLFPIVYHYSQSCTSLFPIVHHYSQSCIIIPNHTLLFPIIHYYSQSYIIIPNRNINSIPNLTSLFPILHYYSQSYINISNRTSIVFPIIHHFQTNEDPCFESNVYVTRIKILFNFFQWRRKPVFREQRRAKPRCHGPCDIRSPRYFPRHVLRMMHRSLDFHYNRFCDSYVVGREKDFLGKSVTYTTAAVMYRDLPLMPSRGFFAIGRRVSFVLVTNTTTFKSGASLSLSCLFVSTNAKTEVFRLKSGGR